MSADLNQLLKKKIAAELELCLRRKLSHCFKPRWRDHKRSLGKQRNEEWTPHQRLQNPNHRPPTGSWRALALPTLQ